MDANILSAHLAAYKELGRLSGQTVNILRPPGGTTVDQTPTPVQTAKSFKVERTGIKLAQPGVHNTELYAVFGDYTLLRQGDIIVPTQSNSTTPDTTVLNTSPGEETVSFKSTRTCSISQGNDYPLIYTNVRFDFLPTGFVRSTFDEFIQGQGALPTLSAILYRLPNFQQNMTSYDGPGLYLIDTGGSQPVRYTITFAEEIGPLTRLTMTLSR